MRNYRFVLIVFLFAGLIVGCSDDDEAGLGDSYFPTPSGHAWIYDNVYKSSGSEQSGQETLTVASVADGEVRFESTVEETFRRGTLTESLANGSIKNTDGKIDYTGDWAFVTIDEHTNVVIPITQLTILDENLEEEGVIYTAEKVTAVDDDFEVVVKGEITIEYSLTVTQKAPTSIEHQGKTLVDVIPVELDMTVHTIRLASEELGGFDVDTFEEDAEDGHILVTNYFAHGKGLIQSETKTTLEFRTIGDIVEEILGESMEPDALEAVGAPNVKPIDATLTQTLTN